MRDPDRRRVPVWVLAVGGVGGGCTIALALAAVVVWLGLATLDDCLGSTENATLATLDCEGDLRIELRRTTTTNNLEGVEFSSMFLRYESATLGGSFEVETLEHDEDIAGAALPPHVIAGGPSTEAVHVFLYSTMMAETDKRAIERCLVDDASAITRAVDAVEPSADPGGRALVVWRVANDGELYLPLEAPGQPAWRLDPRGQLIIGLTYELLGTVARSGDGWALSVSDPRLTEEALAVYRAPDGRTLREVFPGLTTQ